MTRDTSRRRERRGRGGIKQVPWRRYRNPYKPIEVLSADQIEAIHDSSLKVLEEIGMDFLDEDSLAILKAAGAEVAPGTQRVRFPRGLVLESVAKAPAEITLHARNPEHSLTVGGNHLNFGSVASAPNVSDLDKGRRPGSFEDYCNLVRLCQSVHVLHVGLSEAGQPLPLPMGNQALQLLVGYPGALDAHGLTGVPRAKEHVTPPEQLLRTGRVEDHPRVDLG